jgi:hypothetical protein
LAIASGVIEDRNGAHTSDGVVRLRWRSPSKRSRTTTDQWGSRIPGPGLLIALRGDRGSQLLVHQRVRRLRAGWRPSCEATEDCNGPMDYPTTVRVSLAVALRGPPRIAPECRTAGCTRARLRRSSSGRPRIATARHGNAFCAWLFMAARTPRRAVGANRAAGGRPPGGRGSQPHAAVARNRPDHVGGGHPSGRPRIATTWPPTEPALTARRRSPSMATGDRNFATDLGSIQLFPVTVVLRGNRGS